MLFLCEVIKTLAIFTPVLYTNQSSIQLYHMFVATALVMKMLLVFVNGVQESEHALPAVL